MSPDNWQTYAEAYAFLGNSLLAPMSQTADAGLHPEFWEAFPDFGDVEVEGALNNCKAYAVAASKEIDQGIDVVQRVSVEYTKLFIGPPSPAAAPWETAYRNPESTVGFGEATFEMRQALREAGLELHNENNQYEDHMGIELLLLSEYCRRVAQDNNGSSISPSLIFSYIEKHPLSWIGPFHSKVAEVYPGSYYDLLLGVAEKILLSHNQN